ncbi:MAG TPA: hypothetical protein VFN37_00575 [Candidatus Baltobacteraceae bacterium]|nr:hypothetical protein [Candidatus Baltobacteraceae bacterium]
MDVIQRMPAFWRVFTIATLAFVVLKILPLLFIGTLLCWAVVVAAGWKYPLSMTEKIQTMSSPTGYAIGMGALMGAAVNFAGVILMLIWSLIWVSIGAGAAAAAAHNHNEALAATSFVAGLGALGWFFSAFTAPFWGAILGAFGGLIGGSQVPKAAVATTSPPSQ